MGFLAVLTASSLPSLLLLAYFYLRDRYDREPLGHLAAAFGLGVLAMLAAYGLARLGQSVVSAVWLESGRESARLFDAFVLAGLVEELAKFVVFMAVVYRWREFDEPFDGLVYGVAVALGLATLENYLVVSRLGLPVAWLRALFAVPAHALFGGVMGYYAGRAKFDRGGRRVADGALALLLPVLFHGAYDYALVRRLDLFVWIAVTALSAGLWAFVLRRARRAEGASPFRPKTMYPVSSAPPGARRR
jgi:RsiW-degrading membrane proteinase PrsW (M82 family)